MVFVVVDYQSNKQVNAGGTSSLKGHTKKLQKIQDGV